MSMRAQASVSEMVDITDKVAALMLVLRGEFDTEIAAVKLERSVLAEQQGIVKTVAQAKTVREAANAYELAAHEAGDKFLAAAADAADKAKAKLVGVEGRETAIGAREQQVILRTTQLDARERAIADVQTTKRAELVERETTLQKAVKNHTIAVAEARKALEAERKAFNDKLAALRA